VGLGEADGIDKKVIALRKSLSDPASKDVKKTARDLDELVMRPVRRLLGDTKHILLSPDGALNLIPFSALVDENEHYLVDRYTITYLTSGRDLLSLHENQESKQPSLVLADPLFGLAHTTEGSPERSASARRSADMGQMFFNRLPGTAREAKALGAILPGVRVLTQEAATESALKQVNGPRILHIATHGFFLPDEPRAGGDGTRGIRLSGGGAAQGRVSWQQDNPLLRSGLALEGANQKRGAGGEDGILTALEVAGLDLWGTKLVVLSACETGVGDVSNGEGVYGLRRALVLAGSESQVMSLWQVSDAATRDLMVAYYKRLMAGEGRTEALRAVQLEMLGVASISQSDDRRGLTLSQRNKRVNYSHPFFWAAFIQSGDWRRMGGQARPTK
jgi:CHAT domain-containing protein